MKRAISGALAALAGLTLVSCGPPRTATVTASPTPGDVSYGSCELDVAGCPSPGAPSGRPGGGSPAPAPSGPSVIAVWPEYGYDSALTGYDAAEHTLGQSNVANLMQSWGGQEDTGGAGYISAGGGFVYSAGTRLEVFPDNPGCARTKGLCQPGWIGPVPPSSQGAQAELTQPAVGGQFVYAGNQPGSVFVFPAGGCGKAQCSPAWIGVTTGQVNAPVTLDGNRLFAVTGDVQAGYYSFPRPDNRLYAWGAGGCGAASCQPAWTGSIPTLGNYLGAPAVGGGRVYAPATDGVAAFPEQGCGAATCSPAWTTKFEGASSVAYIHGTLFVSGVSQVAALDAASGGEYWTTPIPGANPNALVPHPIAVAYGYVYVMGAGGELLALNASSGAIAWKGAVGGSGPPTVANGLVYAGGPGNHGAVAFPARGCGQPGCAPIWTGDWVTGAGGGTVFVAGGKLYGTDADVLMTYRLGGP